MRSNLILAMAVLAALALPFAASGQNQSTTPQARPGDPLKTIPEKIEPPKDGTQGSKTAPDAPAGSLSERLSEDKGVIKPPTGVDPEIHVPAPAPETGNMPIIRPPGTPGNSAPIDPK